MGLWTYENNASNAFQIFVTFTTIVINVTWVFAVIVMLFRGYRIADKIQTSCDKLYRLVTCCCCKDERAGGGGKAQNNDRAHTEVIHFDNTGKAIGEYIIIFYMLLIYAILLLILLSCFVVVLNTHQVLVPAKMVVCPRV